ncbi:hypothetical protein SCG7086_AN_00080 [Chlamydiales bacterium SCGC AG-110-P3]|nr:hypothetical protein SCG7086_AN_00080 [Chlamydiales bacterium SCGC AG-110-P3]
MNNPYDPTSSIRDQRRYIGDEARAQQADGKSSVVYRKEKTRRTTEMKDKDFEKVMTRNDKSKKEAKTSKATADEAKGTQSPFAFLGEPEESSYVPSSHEQQMRQQISDQGLGQGKGAAAGMPMATDSEDAAGMITSGDVEKVTVGAEQVAQFHSPTGEQTLQPTVAPAEAAAARPVITEEMRALLDLLIDKMYIAQQKGQNDTLITLKHPPVLEGTLLKMSSFDVARGQFNLAFSGLTQEGKNILDANQAALHHAMEAKGFVVHIVTTSTVEEAPFGELEKAPRDDEENAEHQEKESDRSPEGEG